MFRARILDEGAATEDELQKDGGRLSRPEIDEAVEYAKNAPLPEPTSPHCIDVFWEG